LRSVTGKQFATGALLALLQQAATAADAAMAALLAEEEKAEREAKPAAAQKQRKSKTDKKYNVPAADGRRCVGCRVTAAVGAAGRRPLPAPVAAPAPRCCRRTWLAWSCAVAHSLLSLSPLQRQQLSQRHSRRRLVQPSCRRRRRRLSCASAASASQMCSWRGCCCSCPAAHRCVCEECADTLILRPAARRLCPKCRKGVLGASRVFDD
jgi:hypothetical protein